MRAAILLFTFLAVQSLGLAQSSTITGKVISEKFDPVAGITVRLEGTGMIVAATTFSDNFGRFRFDNIPRGIYEIVVELSGINQVHFSFDQIRQRVEVRGYNPDVTVTVPITNNQDSASTDSVLGTVDVSELGGDISRKALNKYGDGIKAKEKGKYDQATELMEETIRLAPNFYRAHNDLGALLENAGKPEDAENHYVRARELNPRAPEPLINLGILCIRRDEFDNAILLLEQAARMSPPHPKASYNLGIALYKAGRYEDAEKALLRAWRLDESYPPVRLMLANVYLKTQAYEKALEQIDSYLRENPNGEDRAAAQEVRSRLLAVLATRAR